MFWDNKPISSKIDFESKQIENIIERNIYKKEIKIPNHLKWNEENDSHKISQFLTYCYKPYSIEYVKYLLSLKDCLVLTIVSKRKNAIYGMIGGYVSKINILGKVDDFVIPLFMSILPEFKNKKMSCVLIEEFTRRYIEKGINCGMILTNKPFDDSVCVIKYFDRIVNYNKMKEIITMPSNIEEKHFNVCEVPREEYKLAGSDKMKELYTLYNNTMFKIVS